MLFAFVAVLSAAESRGEIHSSASIVGVVKSFDENSVRIQSGDVEVRIPRNLVKTPIKSGTEVEIPVPREQLQQLQFIKPK